MIHHTSPQAITSTVPQRGWPSPDSIALALLIGYTLIFSWLTIRQHNSFGTRALDLGKFDQAIWNTAHGRPYHISLSETLVIQSHFSPALALYAPLYWLWSNVRLLFIVQSLFMAAAGFLIYRFFRKQNPWLALAVYAAYLMHPSLHQVNLVEFRRLTLAVIGTSFTLYHMLKQNYTWMTLGLLLTLLCKEDMAFTCIGVGLYLFWRQREYKLGVLITLVGIAYLVLIPFVVLPAINAGGRGYGHAGANFGYLGSTPDEIFTAILQEPSQLLSYAFQPARLQALFHFLCPTLFIFILAPDIAAFLLPYLGYLMTSTADAQGQLEAWYPSVLLIFLFWSVSLGLQRLRPQWRTAAALLLLIAGLSNWLLYSQLWPGAQFNARHYEVTTHDRYVRAALKTVPTSAIVAAQDALVPHVSQRSQVYLYPWIPSEVELDYIVLDRSMGMYPIPLAQYRTYFYNIFAGTEYHIEHQIDDFYLFRRMRVTPDVSRHDTWGHILTLTGYTVNFSHPDGNFQQTGSPSQTTARVELLWKVEQATSQNYTVFVHLLDQQQQILAQHDSWPADEHRPTSILAPGDVIRDVHYLSWNGGTAAEAFFLRIGLYDSVSTIPLVLPDEQTFIIVQAIP